MDNGYEKENYYIQQVSDMTGLSKQVIRKWEERHELVQPGRLANGYRVYKEKDVNTLLKVKLLAEQGYSIKQAAEIVNLEHEETPKDLEEVASSYEKLNNHVFQLLEKGFQCDEFEMNLILQQAYHHYGLESFLSSVIIPFLKEIGIRWEKEEWDEYQEALSSIVVRDYLIQIRRNYRFRDDAPLLLGACLPLEMHEVPLHIILLQCMLRGWKTVLIGSSPAVGSIQSLITKLGPQRVVLSATTTIPFEQHPNILQELDQFAIENKEIDFFLGGQGAVKYTKEVNPLKNIKIIETIDDIADMSSLSK